jgi:hypothetical protein
MPRLSTNQSSVRLLLSIVKRSCRGIPFSPPDWGSRTSERGDESRRAGDKNRSGGERKPVSGGRELVSGGTKTSERGTETGGRRRPGGWPPMGSTAENQADPEAACPGVSSGPRIGSYSGSLRSSDMCSRLGPEQTEGRKRTGAIDILGEPGPTPPPPPLPPTSCRSARRDGWRQPEPPGIATERPPPPQDPEPEETPEPLPGRGL